MRKGGAITHTDKQDQHSVAIRTLNKVKSCAKELSKIPIRVDHKTIIMVSPKKYKQMKKCVQ